MDIEQLSFYSGMWVEAVKLLWKHFNERSWKRKHLTFWGAEVEGGSIFHNTWGRDVKADRSWKRKQTRKRLTLYGAGSGSKKYSTASTSLLLLYRMNKSNDFAQYSCVSFDLIVLMYCFIGKS